MLKIITIKQLKCKLNNNEKIFVTQQISYNCKNCNSLVKRCYDSLKLDSLYCKFCRPLFLNKPELNGIKIDIKFIKSKLTSFKEYIKYSKIGIKTKKLVKGKCIKCKNNFKMSFNGLVSRKHFPLKELCQKCYLNFTLSSDVVREINSKAQLIAQNKPETQEKQRLIQIQIRKDNPSIITRMSKKISKFWKSKDGEQRKKSVRLKLQNLWSTKEYQNLQALKNKNGYLSGHLNGIFFQSSYELSFINYCIDNKISIIRSNINFKYKNENKIMKLCIPDFIINENTIVEIKPFKLINHKINKNKIKAIKKYCKNNNLNFKLITEKDLNYKVEKLEDLIKLKNKYKQDFKITCLPKGLKNELSSYYKNRKKKI